MSCPTALSSGLLAAGTTTVVSRKSYLNSVVVVSDGTNAATVVVYDNTAASGTVLAKATTPTSGTTHLVFDAPIRASIGITVVVSGTGAEAIIHYDA
jgi:hypothetical protein